MQVTAQHTNTSTEPFWPIQDGHFVLPESLHHVRCAKGRGIARAVAHIDNGVRVFLRGSLLESCRPFERSDTDLIVVFIDREQLFAVRDALPQGHNYDVRVLDEASEQLDPVDLALLNCRSLQVCGPAWPRMPIPATKAFAWQHWVKYCPSLIPGVLDTRHPTTLTHFKLLTRCFGVLSFLLHRRFTRDITTCLAFAREQSANQADRLNAIRSALEQRRTMTFDVTDVKRCLHRDFDTYFHPW